MPLSATEKIKIAMNRLKINNTDLAERTGWSRQNITNKFGRNNLTEKDIEKIVTALGCTADFTITLPNGFQI